LTPKLMCLLDLGETKLKAGRDGRQGGRQGGPELVDNWLASTEPKQGALSFVSYKLEAFIQAVEMRAISVSVRL